MLPRPVADALRVRHAARLAVDAANRATRSALETLAREGFAFHDAATMLGLSPSEIERYGPAGPAVSVPRHPASSALFPAPGLARRFRRDGRTSRRANAGPLQMADQ